MGENQGRNIQLSFVLFFLNPAILKVGLDTKWCTKRKPSLLDASSTATLVDYAVTEAIL